jgi:soluble lytic murein transglycosylase
MIEWIQRGKWWLFGIILLGGLVTWIKAWRSQREHSQDGVILAASAKHAVDPALVKAVVWRESWFDPNARGSSGEVGLMQIMKDTANDWAAAERATHFAHSQLYNPAKNTDCGAWYLRRLLNRYRHTDDPVVYALAAYNAGPTRVAKWSKGAAATNSTVVLEEMDFPGTRKYVRSVTRRYQHYRGNFPPGKTWPEHRL